MQLNRILLVALLLIASAFTLRAQGGKPLHTIHAVRIADKIDIDGSLNDEAWIKAPVEWDFTQRDPMEGGKPTEKTELRIVYDDSSIYFGVRLYDSEPQKIVRQLSRRDNFPDADRFTLQLSPNHDRLTGALFEVSAAGVQRDAIISNDVFTDYAWDGVWESAAHIDDEGWSVEMRIPFSQLRFPPGDRQIWGINASRFIHRKNEAVWLQMVPKKESGTASRMDDLEGIDGLESHRHLDLMPYFVARGQFIQPMSQSDPFNDGSRYFGATGMDIKYGISSNFTLDATVNPDFGQVEVDPAVVNLSAFETFFPEKRPFFLEGANIFSNFGQGGSNNFWGFNRQEPNIFYTRRIGRAPQGSAGTAEFVDRPTATTILGAGKLTGKTRNGWTLGLLEAVTGRESAEVVNQGNRSQVPVEPVTNYVVARVLKESRRAGIGFLTTGVQRRLDVASLRDLLPQRANVIGTDGYWYPDSKKNWVLHGRFSGSFVKGSASSIERLQRAPQHYFQRPDAAEVSLQPGATSMKGSTGALNLNRQTGNVLVNAAVWGVSPGFESNDLGFQTGGDMGGAHTVVLWRKTSPDRFTRDRNIWISKWWKWNYGRKLIGNGFNAAFNLTFLNYWGMFGNTGFSLPVRDDRLTRGGPASSIPGGSFFSTGFWTDSRKKVSFNPFLNMSRTQPSAWNVYSELGVTYKPTPSITISSAPSLSRSRGVQYVKTVQDATATQTYGSRYIFSEIDQSAISLTSRVNWILSPKMSLQVYMQPFVSVGDYFDFKEFARPNTFNFSRYGREIGEIAIDSQRQYTVDPDGAAGPAGSFSFSDPDFNFKSLRMNAIFRWEWRLGSTLYFVWQENRQDLSNPGKLSPGRDIARVFSARPDDVFLVRLAYWVSR